MLQVGFYDVVSTQDVASTYDVASIYDVASTYDVTGTYDVTSTYDDVVYIQYYHVSWRCLAPFGHKFGECAFNKIYICTGYMLPTI